MEIRLPQMPFKFESPDGLMEVTVRSGVIKNKVEMPNLYAAAAVFISHGARALERIQITPSAASHTAVMKTLLTGFDVDPDAHEKDGLDHRVLTALCNAQGVVLLDN
jgi:hypothetical protein